MAPRLEPLSEADDYSLIRRVAGHDRQAFEVLYRRYARRLAGYLGKFLQQPELVEEVLVDVMLVVWQNAARFNYQSRLSTWIFGIAYHKALKAMSHSARPEPLPQSPAWNEDDDPAVMLSRQEQERAITEALESLSPAHRVVVELTFYHARSYQEIATITGCPVNTVKTRMFHARPRLANALTSLDLRHAAEKQEEAE